MKSNIVAQLNLLTKVTTSPNELGSYMALSGLHKTAVNILYDRSDSSIPDLG